MPFESKLFPSDEALPERDGQVELPDDLALMGEQLRDDAQRLAACYPPRLGPVAEVAAAVAAVQARPGSAVRRTAIVSTAVGGLVALGVLLVVTLNMNGPPNHWQREEAAQPMTVTSNAARTPKIDQTERLVTSISPGLASESNSGSPSELALPAGFTGAMPAVTPAVLRSGITGPEMEAWIDLRKDELAMDVESIEF